jgi:hypothetical protein
MAPAESYARIGVEPIFDRGEVVYPDVIMVFHPQVITMGKSYTMPFYSGRRHGPSAEEKSLPLGASCSHARRCCASSSRQAREG